MAYMFKIAVVGDAAVGKTSLVKRIVTGEYKTPHYPTLGVERTLYTMYTTRVRVSFDIRDCARWCSSEFFRDSDAAIAVFALDSLASYTNVANYISLARSECGDIPVVVCGNKADSPNYEVDTRNISIPANSVYLTVSARNWTGLSDIFLVLARQLLGDTELRAVEAPAVEPPIVTLPPVILSDV